MANERWEDDETGSGVSDGEAFAPPIRALLEEMARADWNTEQPEAHLLPHLERHTEGGATLRLEGARDNDGVFVVELTAVGADRAEIRRLVYPLIETIAEPMTVIVEREDAGASVFDVTLAVTPGQGPCPKGHGHLVRLRVAR